MQDTQVQAAPVETQNNEKEMNFARIRQQLDRERQEKEQLAQRLEALERATKHKAPADDEDDSDEPYVDVKRLDKKLNKFAAQMEQKIEEKAEQKARAMIDAQERNAYMKHNQDFQEVMAPDVVEKFANTHPAIAETILRMPDGFERQKLVYETIKALGVNRPKTTEPTIQQKIDANRRSPYYQPSGVASSPYQTQGDFSPTAQKSSYEKMKELQKNLRL